MPPAWRSNAMATTSTAAHARYLEVRRLLLIGRLDDAERVLALLDPQPLPPALKTFHSLTIAGVAIRRLQAKTARDALMRATELASTARIPALIAEVENAMRILEISCGSPDRGR